jgi:hypothetical protein
VTLQTRAAENFRSCRWGDERTVKRAQTVSEDPHRRERNNSKVIIIKFTQNDVVAQDEINMGTLSTKQGWIRTDIYKMS